MLACLFLGVKILPLDYMMTLVYGFGKAFSKRRMSQVFFLVINSSCWDTEALS